MRQWMTSWATRANMTTGALYVSLGLAMLCTFLAGWNVIQWNENRRQEQDIRVLQAQRAAEESAKIAAKRVEIQAAHARCLALIPDIKRTNRILLGFRDFLYDTANDTVAVIREAPGDPANQARWDAVEKRRALAKSIRTYKVGTEKECNDVRDAALKTLPGAERGS